MQRRLSQKVSVTSAIILLITTVSRHAAAQSCLPPPPGMTAWWPGNGTGNETIAERNGILIGSAGFAPGMVHDAFIFGGSGEVQVADDPSWTLGTGDFSIDLWVNFVTVTGRDPFIGHDNGAGEQDKWIFWFDSNGHDKLRGIPALRFHINSPHPTPVPSPHDAVAAPWSPVPGQWYLVAVTRSGSTYTLYIDGAPVAQDTSVYAIPDPVAPLTIGRSEGLWLNGRVDEAEIFHRALSSSEIQALYNAGSSGKCTGTQAPLTVSAPENAVYATSFPVTASGGSGMGEVTFSASGACSNVDGAALVTMTSGTGVCLVTATRAGDTTYGPISADPVAVTAMKANQVISFGPLSTKMIGDPPFAVSASGGPSGNPVTFATTTRPVCTSGDTNGATITLVAPGTCTVRASQMGDDNYTAASDVDGSFLVRSAVTFSGLFEPWNPPGPGTYNGMTFTSGRVYKMNSTLPLKWGYASAGVLVDSARSSTADYPVVHIAGPLASCGDIDGAGVDAVASYTGPGSATTTYDPVTKSWQRNVKLDAAFQADRCYLVQVTDPVTATISPWFPFKTKR
jgi:hypothetical protein